MHPMQVIHPSISYNNVNSLLKWNGDVEWPAIVIMERITFSGKRINPTLHG